MIQLTNKNTQDIPLGGSLNFDTVLHQTGQCECFSMQLPNSVRLMGLTGSLYLVLFFANVNNNLASRSINLSIALNGVPIKEALMQTTIPTAFVRQNVSAGTIVRIECSDINRLSIVNSGSASTGQDIVTVGANSSFIIKRLA